VVLHLAENARLSVSVEVVTLVVLSPGFILLALLIVGS
jgi:hypothetical protein